MTASTMGRTLAFAGLLAALAGCTSTGAPTTQLEANPVAAIDPRDCPRIMVREEGAVLRQGTAPDYQYVASVSEVTRSCRIEGGEIVMDVGIAGRVVPGTAARATQVTLPMRVRASDSTTTLHDKVGRVSVAIAPGGPSNFTYVDRGVRVPAGRKVIVDAGIDG